MPVMRVKNGYRWGKHGKIYKVSKYGKSGAYRMALKQGRAIWANKNKRVR